MGIVYLASSTLSETVSAAAAPQRRAVFFRPALSSWLALLPPQLLRREVRADDPVDGLLSCDGKRKEHISGADAVKPRPV